MCTLVVIRTPEHPLLVGATRDERPDRPTLSPAFLTPEIFAPKDQVFGGTWLGVNTHGMLVAITNSDHGDDLHKIGGPRASLVKTCLHASSVEDALEHAWTETSLYVRGYHMVIAGTEQAFLVWHFGRDKGFKIIPEGVTVITTMGFDPGHCKRDKGIRDRLKKSPVTREALQMAMSFHGKANPEDGACVHGKDVTMESVHHMIVEAKLDSWQVSWKEGRTCQKGSYTEVTI